VRPGPTDAATRWDYAGALRHVLAAVRRCHAVGVRSHQPFAPGHLGVAGLGLAAEWVLRSAPMRPLAIGRRIAPRLRSTNAGHGYVAIVVGAVYDALVVIWQTTAAPRWRVPTPKPRAKKLSCNG
jgi:hypothetical protein